MKRWVLGSAIALSLVITGALAQQAVTCATRPAGDSSNACASTAFVQNAISSISIALGNGQIFVGNASNVPTARTMSGDVSITNTAVASLAAIGSATGPIGSTTTTPVVTIDTKGRVTALTSATIAATNLAACGWRMNFAMSPNNTAPTTLKWLIGPAFFMPCQATGWNQDTSPTGGSTWNNNYPLFVANVGQGGRGSLIQSHVNILHYNGNGCTAGTDCVSQVGTYANVTFTNASPTVVTWTAHGLAAGRTVSFCDGNSDFYGPDCRYGSPGTMATGIDQSKIYYVCGNGIAANTFSLSSTYALAIANTCDINTSSTGSGTLKGNNGRPAGLDAGSPVGANNYNIFLVARALPTVGGNDWGLVWSAGGCTAAGPSAAVQATYPYWMCIDWIRTNGATPPTAYAFMTMKNNYRWALSGGTGTGGAGTAVLQQLATGVQSQWTGVDPSSLGLDGNTGRFQVTAIAATNTKFFRVAPNVHFGNYIPCGAVGVGGVNVSTPCDVTPDEGLIGVWSDDTSGFLFLLGGDSGF